MEFIDLKKQQAKIRDRIDANIKRVLDHGRYINGPEVSELEERLADYTGTKYAVGVSSGTDALLMPLMAYNVGPSDAVFTTAFSFFATAEVISLLGAVPVFVDIDADTYNIDPAKLGEKIEETKREGKLALKGIIPVDLFGQAADYDEIHTIAKNHNLFVLEDAAQSFGGSYKGERNCSFGDAAATSFFPAKPLGCYGDGGMIFTDNESLYKELLSIRIHGKGAGKYDNVRVGINGRLDTIQAAILLAKMDIFDEELEAKQKVAEYYTEVLKDVVKTPVIKNHNVSAWAQYSVQSGKRDAIIEALEGEGIPSMIYYNKPLPFQKVYDSMGFKKGDFPVAEEVSDRIFSLPMHASLKKKDIERISGTITG